MCRRQLGPMGPDGSTPAVSVTLRNLVRQMFPDEAREREAEVQVPSRGP